MHPCRTPFSMKKDLVCDPFQRTVADSLHTICILNCFLDSFWDERNHCLHYYNSFLLQLFVSLSFAYPFPDVASLVDFLYCLVCFV